MYTKIMNLLPLTILRMPPEKIIVELDADKFERLAANFGSFNSAFLKSIERAEREIAQGKGKALKSLRDLREA